MSGFKKKDEVPETIPHLTQKLNMLLGLGSNASLPPKSSNCKLTMELILACASFWDSKQRIDKIKSLILKDQDLQQFNDTDDFKVDDLRCIELLSVSKNRIIHLHPLANLDTLLCLNINNNKVYDISPLAELTKLQQLYAANNQINLLDGLKNLQKLHILNLYNNRVNRFEDSIQILSNLHDLQELDIQLNPIYQQSTRSQFLVLPKILRLNGQLVQQEKDIPMSASCFIPSAKFRDTHTSFFTKKSTKGDTDCIDSNYSSSGSSAKEEKVGKEKKNKQFLRAQLMELQQKFFSLDDRFEEQIVKNVQLKSEYHKKMMLKRELQRKKQEGEEKQSEVKQLKRKVKTLKQNLFGNSNEPNSKASLLRQLFELQMMKSGETKQISTSPKNHQSQTFVRKFDFDFEIIVEQGNNEQYLTEEDAEIEMLLSSNSSALEQLKRELRELTN